MSVVLRSPSILNSSASGLVPIFFTVTIYPPREQVDSVFVSSTRTLVAVVDVEKGSTL